MITSPYRLAHVAVVDQQPAPPLPLFVDTVAGTAAGTGTAASPLNSLDAARVLCAGLPDWVIKVTAPITAPLRQEVIYESSLNLTIEGVNDVPWYIFASDLMTGWTLVGGGVYSKALTATTVAPVVVRTMTETLDGQSFELILIQNTATPTTPAAGEFGFTANTLYVRLPGDANPSSHTIEAGRRNTCLQTRGYGRLTVRDVNARYAVLAPILNGASVQPLGTGKLTVEDSFVGYTGRGGSGIAASGQTEDTVCTRVTARRAGNDGFNLHTTSGAAVMTLNGCDGSFNGHVAGDSAQGCSNHETTTMIVNGGTYNSNVSGGMVVIDSARCDIHGDTAYGPVTMDKNMRLGNTAGTIASQAGCAWLNSSRGAVTGPVTVSNGQGTGVRVATAGAVTGLGNITSTGNAQPNVIA